jgi:hypothetical protein
VSVGRRHTINRKEHYGPGAGQQQAWGLTCLLEEVFIEGKKVWNSKLSLPYLAYLEKITSLLKVNLKSLRYLINLESRLRQN